MSQMMKIRDAMLTALLTASRVRSVREDFDESGEPGWVAYEQGVMLAEVNDWRQMSGLPPASLVTIARIERSAAGHVDYAEKYALRCAFLALDLEWRD